MSKLHVFDHPLIHDKMTFIRKQDTGTKNFRETVNEIAALMTYEIFRDLQTEEVEIETPVTKTVQKAVSEKVVIVPILRAGLGMVDGILSLVPTARVGHVGIYRDEETLVPHEYFAKFPTTMKEALTLVVDPMLATGGSAVEAIRIVKEQGAKRVKLVCLVGVTEGIQAVKEAHPDVDIYLAALDNGLNEASYITPGLGDAGDRLFGTK